MNVLDTIENTGLRRDLPPFRTGDTVRVHVRVSEGDKQRIQVFEGVVIRRRGAGTSATLTVRKVSYGVGVERIFPVESPNVAKLEIKSRGHVRRARLYYLRELSGKKARLRAKLRDLSALVAPADLDPEPTPEATEAEPAAASDGEAPQATEAADATPAAGESAPEAQDSDDASKPSE